MDPEIYEGITKVIKHLVDNMSNIRNTEHRDQLCKFIDVVKKHKTGE